MPLPCLCLTSLEPIPPFIVAAIPLASAGGAFFLEYSICHDATNATLSPNAVLPNTTLGYEIDAPIDDTPFRALCDAKSYVTVMCMIVYLLCFGIGMSPVPWAINAEIYPLRVRTECVGIATAANWMTNFLVAATFLSLQDAVSKPGAFWLYGCVAVLGAMWLCTAMPETSGKTLEQIERLFER